MWIYLIYWSGNVFIYGNYWSLATSNSDLPSTEVIFVKCFTDWRFHVSQHQEIKVLLYNIIPIECNKKKLQVNKTKYVWCCYWMHCILLVFDEFLKCVSNHIYSSINIHLTWLGTKGLFICLFVFSVDIFACFGRD